MGRPPWRVPDRLRTRPPGSPRDRHSPWGRHPAGECLTFVKLCDLRFPIDYAELRFFFLSHPHLEPPPKKRGIFIQAGAASLLGVREICERGGGDI